MDSFMNRQELESMGFKSLGENVLISKKASIYGADKMEIGNHVRIDDFCFLTGKIIFGNYIHITASSIVRGDEKGVYFEDFSTISPNVTIHADSNDYSGKSLTSAMVPEEFKPTEIRAAVYIRKHVIVGTNTVILPGVELGEGSAVGAMSLVTKDTEPWTINAGIPSKPIGTRSRELLKLEKQFLNNESKTQFF